jgi:nucleoside-diphosphate-sugar epimerase
VDGQRKSHWKTNNHPAQFENPYLKRVLVTGAAGRLGSLVSTHLADQFLLGLCDNLPLPQDSKLPFVLCNLVDINALRSCCQGFEVVLHLGAVSHPTATWQELLPSNIVGVYNLFQAAFEANCKRVVFASSVMVVDGYPSDLMVGSDMPPRPSTLYGVSKAWGESVGRYYAEQHGLSVICLRLGWVVHKRDKGLVPGSSSLNIALTEVDLLRLFSAALNAPPEIQFGIFNGISDNRHKRLDIEETRQVLGYVPRDDSYNLAKKNYLAMAFNKLKKLRKITRSKLKF